MEFIVAPMRDDDPDPKRSLRFLKSKGGRVYTLTEQAISEKRNNAKLIKHVFGLLYAVLFKVIGVHSAEIPLIFRRGLRARLISFELLPFTENVPGKGLGNDRYVSVTKVRVWGRYWTIFGLHFNAVIQNHDFHSKGYGDFLDIDRWHVTKAAMPQLAARIRDAKLDSDAVLVGGDTNTLPVGEGLTDPDSIYVILHELGFRTTNERVTLMAAWGAELESKEVYPPGKHGWGSDHAAIKGRFRRPPLRVQ